MTPLLVAALLIIAVLGALRVWRYRDRRFEDSVWRTLADKASDSGSFDPSMVESLPPAAQKFFRYTIAQGASLRCVTVIRMRGELGLGTRERPGYRPMHADQILAPPHGLVWKVRTGPIAGSDGFDGNRSWVRFWLAGILPIVRAGGDADHARAAFGRVVAEAVFWAPAALLPQHGVTWEEVAANVARATVKHARMTQTVDVTVAADGQPTLVVIPRWSDANPDKVYRLQPFGGYLSEFREFDGYKLPTHVEGGNFVGTAAYFPFYKADVEALRFVAGN